MGISPEELDDLLLRGFRYAYSLCHDRPQAEDLLQDACLRLGKKDGPWKASYLYSTIRNRWIDLKRRDKIVQFESFESDSSEEGHAAYQDNANLISLPPPPSSELDLALQRLGDKERELLFLHLVEGYTTKELAEQFDRPRGTIMSTIHRAKGKVREHLRQLDPDSPMGKLPTKDQPTTNTSNPSSPS
ncbi:MAG: RNA polymerase sigma factor [Verrucomicrobiota bacterium]